MTIATWIGFLFGKADAIQEVATARHTLWLGLVFVLSAGLAREYDQEDLLREPWHVFLPLAVSLGTSFILYTLLQLFTNVPAGEPRMFWRGYQAFLGLYWLMAPMAWLYAFPAERLMSEFDAMRTNLWLLGAVSLWRVLLMTRIVFVLWKGSLFAASTIVGFFALTIALIALYFSPTPIIEMMGGVKLSAAEMLLRDVNFAATGISVLLWPFFFLMLCVVFATSNLKCPNWLPPTAPPTRSVWIFAAAVLAGLAALLPFTQPEQQNRRRAEELLRRSDIEQGLTFVCATGRNGFPPVWDPPPQIVYSGRDTPDIGDIIERHLKSPLPPWLEETYLNKLANAINRREPPYDNYREKVRYLHLLQQLPQAALLVNRHRESFEETTYFSLPEGSPEQMFLRQVLEAEPGAATPPNAAAHSAPLETAAD